MLLLERLLREAGVVAVDLVVGKHGVVAGISEDDGHELAVGALYRHHRYIMIHRTRQVSQRHAPPIHGEAREALAEGQLRGSEVLDGESDEIDDLRQKRLG